MGSSFLVAYLSLQGARTVAASTTVLVITEAELAMLSTTSMSTSLSEYQAVLDSLFLQILQLPLQREATKAVETLLHTAESKVALSSEIYVA